MARMRSFFVACSMALAVGLIALSVNADARAGPIAPVVESGGIFFGSIICDGGGGYEANILDGAATATFASYALVSGIGIGLDEAVRSPLLLGNSAGLNPSLDALEVASIGTDPASLKI